MAEKKAPPREIKKVYVANVYDRQVGKILLWHVPRQVVHLIALRDERDGKEAGTS